jgi:hypothetical protein
MPAPINELTQDQILDILDTIKAEPPYLRAWVDGMKDRRIVGICHDPGRCLVAQAISDQLEQAIRFDADSHFTVSVGRTSASIRVYHASSSTPFIRKEISLSRQTTLVIDEFDRLDRFSGQEDRVSAGRVRRKMSTLYPESV